jgi:hypothetical protein
MGSLKPGDRCTESIQCSSSGCTRPGASSDLKATGQPDNDVFAQCGAASEVDGTCCTPAGTKPTNGDALFCCSGFDVNAEGLCCLREGARPSGEFPNFNAHDCCSNQLDENGFCTKGAPNPKPAGQGCYRDTDCSSGTCDRPCGSTNDQAPVVAAPDLPGRCL